jgi:hypothetical protein
MSISNTTAQNILKALYKQTNWSADAAIYMSLHTADPGATGASEVTDASYARVNVTSSWAAPSSASISNNATITFQFMTTGFTATHIGIWDAVSSGNFRRGFAITSLVVPAGDRPFFSSGDLTDTAA